jgi:hypothetical protein
VNLWIVIVQLGNLYLIQLRQALVSQAYWERYLHSVTIKKYGRRILVELDCHLVFLSDDPKVVLAEL